MYRIHQFGEGLLRHSATPDRHAAPTGRLPHLRTFPHCRLCMGLSQLAHRLSAATASAEGVGDRLERWPAEGFSQGCLGDSKSRLLLLRMSLQSQAVLVSGVQGQGKIKNPFGRSNFSGRV